MDLLCEIKAAKVVVFFSFFRFSASLGAQKPFFFLACYVTAAHSNE